MTKPTKAQAAVLERLRDGMVLHWLAEFDRWFLHSETAIVGIAVTPKRTSASLRAHGWVSLIAVADMPPWWSPFRGRNYYRITDAGRAAIGAPSADEGA